MDGPQNMRQSVIQLSHNDTKGIENTETMSNFWNSVLFGNGTSDDQPPIFDPRRQTQTLFKVQLYVCSALGVICFLTFCFFRYKFPLVYSVRSYRSSKIKKLPNDMFSWIKVLISINNEQMLQVIGLESYVFLCFFKMSIKILITLSILGLCILSPIRYLLIGSFDRDNSSPDFITKLFNINKSHNDENSEPVAYLAISVVFTYLFTAIIFFFLFKETNHIIKVRQRFLGSQRSITDRTILVKNIPFEMCSKEALKRHIEELNVGKIDEINFVHDYSLLTKLLEKRQRLIEDLEIIYSRVCGLEIHLSKSPDIQRVHLKTKLIAHLPKADDIAYNPDNNNDSSAFEESGKYSVLNFNYEMLNKKRRECFKEVKSLKTVIESKIEKILKLDQEITTLKEQHSRILPQAFITMDTVTDAQMAAQAVFSPKAFVLTTELAPAPLDVNWNNLLLSSKSVFFRRNLIELIIILFSCLLIIPIRYITSLLNVNSIRKIWKEFGDYLLKHDKIRTVVTGLLPTYLFTIINVILPYVISILSNLQGLGSKGDVEISVIRKNFLYIFFNLFLVFTLFGTLSSYKALLTDTTKIAPLLATSIKSLSLFYIDLILLQGLTMFPFKLLQVGDIFMLFWNFLIKFKQRTPRLFKNSLYQPQIFDLGLILPQHILIFIITILYSAISTKILVSGLVYFTLGFYTYKYQLVYSLVHPYHSTGKAWPIIFKRVCLGIFFLHLQMFGSLALEQSFVLAGLMLPLFPTTIIVLMFFDRNYRPLLHYIALDAIKTHGKISDSEFDDGLNGLLNASGIPSNELKRKTSAVSFNRLLDGDEQCDAVIIDSPGSHLPPIEECATENSSDSNTDLDSVESQSHIEPGDLDVTCLSENVLRSNSGRDRRCSTIEEEREANATYTHPCLLDPCNGVMIGFDQNAVDYLNFRILNTSTSSEDSDPAVRLVEYNDNNIENGCDELPDVENNAFQIQFSGYIVRDDETNETW
ncbi:hypothetical protein CANINC_004427 [Pichia inconspicua]|uniref:CSC1/OSCA1-like 7TM region domain-containing protein n=1 Tax=Pichia inconspicua TaxID=52247 RepID=A0A4T0WW97_9ASCO|nr:hypothetical protein CANINC_004427 [[Candida] inconspicua]